MTSDTFAICPLCGYEIDLSDNTGHYENDSDPSDYCRARGRV